MIALWLLEEDGRTWHGWGEPPERCCSFPGGYKQPCRSSEYHGARRSKVPQELARQASNLRPRREKSEGNETHTTWWSNTGPESSRCAHVNADLGLFHPQLCHVPGSKLGHPQPSAPSSSTQKAALSSPGAGCLGGPLRGAPSVVFVWLSRLSSIRHRPAAET